MGDSSELSRLTRRTTIHDCAAPTRLAGTAERRNGSVRTAIVSARGKERSAARYREKPNATRSIQSGLRAWGVSSVTHSHAVPCGKCPLRYPYFKFEDGVLQCSPKVSNK